jgi:hypothetical protein
MEGVVLALCHVYLHVCRDGLTSITITISISISNVVLFSYSVKKKKRN